MSTGRTCYVNGCTNSDYKLHRWAHKICPIHQCFLGTGHCTCPKPFALHTFPTKKKANEKRQRWLQSLQRYDPKNPDCLLEPRLSHRVCSDHFVMGEPTVCFPDPTLKLGIKRPHKKEVQENGAELSGEETDDAEEAIQLELQRVKKLKRQAFLGISAPKTFSIRLFLLMVCLISMLLSLWRKAVAKRNEVYKENLNLHIENQRLRYRLSKKVEEIETIVVLTNDDTATIYHQDITSVE